jgi:hypothetical protein
MPGDLTKASSHIIWLWTAVSAIAIACFSGYMELRDRSECLAAKISANEMSLRIQLAEIQTKLNGIESTLFELKRDLHRREDKQ